MSLNSCGLYFLHFPDSSLKTKASINSTCLFWKESQGTAFPDLSWFTALNLESFWEDLGFSHHRNLKMMHLRIVSNLEEDAATSIG